MELKVFSGQASLDLAAKICSYLNAALGKMSYRKFSDGEIWVQFEENIRGADVFLIQSTYSPAENIWELLLMIDAAKRASAARICVVIPYYGYARQDRKDESRVPISAKLKADLISAAGAHRVLAMDLHAGQIQGFFNIPMDHIYAKPVFVEYFVKYLRNELSGPLTILSPDVGANKIARSYAKRLENSPIAIVDKRRPAPDSVEVLSIIGETKERSVLIVDDIIDTGGTLTESAKKAKQHGAKQIFAFCTHGVLSGNALKLINESPIEKLFITDTIPFRSLDYSRAGAQKIEIISVAKIFAEAIKRIHEEKSVSSLFD